MEKKIQVKGEENKASQEVNAGETLTAQEIEAELRNIFKQGNQ